MGHGIRGGEDQMKEWDAERIRWLCVGVLAQGMGHVQGHGTCNMLNLQKLRNYPRVRAKLTLIRLWKYLMKLAHSHYGSSSHMKGFRVVQLPTAQTGWMQCAPSCRLQQLCGLLNSLVRLGVMPSPAGSSCSAAPLRQLRRQQSERRRGRRRLRCGFPRLPQWGGRRSIPHAQQH